MKSGAALRSGPVRVSGRAAFVPLYKLEGEPARAACGGREAERASRKKIAALGDELALLGAVSEPWARLLRKYAEAPAPAVSEAEAEAALHRLRRLEETKPTADQAARGALVGSVVGPVAGVLNRAISGPAARTGPVVPGARALIAMGVHGGLFGGLMPVITSKLERQAERRKLQRFLDARSGTKSVESGGRGA
jgi:hypothetical protein